MIGALGLLACPKEKEPGMVSATAVETTTTAAGTTTGTTTGATTTGGTTTGVTSAGGTMGGGSTGADCGGSFLSAGCDLLCGPGEMCVDEWSGDTGRFFCRPNPDGCVPSDPCSPACKAICGDGFLCMPGCDMLTCHDPVKCLVGGFRCNQGLKCVPLDSLGKGMWSGTDCVPIDPAPAKVGEPCTRDEVTGVDSCENDVLCVDGTCVPMCPAGKCPPGMACVDYLGGAVRLCEPACDPLMPLCAADEECVQWLESFVCVADKSGAEG